MTTLSLLAVGLGAPAVGLLVERWLTADDVGRAMRRHHEALAALADLTRTGAGRP